ncbi:hypothetical protein [Pseudanabaena sp. PCC 6802]|uniref:hypothetical protein n=1 Tax=Pseudanabaena sp. PCC 6802 TaxID=118173 RepID=UPI00034D843E|nr:hypothetical protein [Pseudanabaena sp. PCC 6802]
MTQPQMTREQEVLLDEALKYAQLFEQQAKELWEQGEAFAQRWEKRLREAEAAAAPNSSID